VRARDEHTFLGIRINGHEVTVGKSINSGLVGNTIVQNIEDDSPAFTTSTRIEISETCIFPKSRANEKYDLAIRGDQLRPRELRVKAIRVRGKDNLLAYRQHGGRQIPVYMRPLGFSTLDRIRGANAWHASLSVPECTASDILAMLAQSGSPPVTNEIGM
jgi:hypothetical protein